MISLYIKLAAIAAILIALAGASAWIHHKGVESGKHSRDDEVAGLQSTIGEQTQAIGEYKAANEHIQALADKCSSAVSLLQQKAAQAGQRAADAMAQARASAVRGQADAERLRTVVASGDGKTCEQAVSEVRTGLKAD